MKCPLCSDRKSICHTSWCYQIWLTLNLKLILVNSFQPTVCDEGTWGDECNQACNCNPETTANCSTETGLCNCQNGWDGNSCTEDINECLDGSASCPENSLCVNVNGSFICKCDTGFTKTNAGVCTGSFAFMFFFLLSCKNDRARPRAIIVSVMAMVCLC